tara:strand:- start:380 stop:1105 length:726 start_codon:yes stop_codon:yes gene_type:complete
MKSNKKKSNVGDNISAKDTNWSFDGNTVFKFDQHIQKSIPYYSAAHEIGLKVSDFFLRDKTNVYDLGSSTGTFLRNLHDRHKNKNLNFYGVDEIKKMIIYSKKKKKNRKISFVNNKIEKINFKKSNFVTSFFTIQFIRPSRRQQVIDKIFKSLEWGGCFLMFEKVRFPDARFQDIMSQIYIDFKLDQGFSEIDIINKSKSLKGVMEPFSSQGNLQLLKRAGFKDIVTVFKYLNFEGFLSIK